MKYLSIVMLFFMVGCGSEPAEVTEENPVIDTLKTDTTEVIEDVQVEVPKRIELDPAELFAKVDTVLTLPLAVDSLFVDSIMSIETTEKALSNAEAQYLGYSMLDNRPTQMASYCIDDFIRMDSLKIKGEYEDYLQQMDIGMTEWAAAQVIGKIKIGSGHEMLLWATHYETYQACPYGHGTYIWSTVFVDGQPLNTALVGENSGGADAPYWGSTFTTSTITEAGIVIDYLEESGGDYDEATDEEIVERSQQKYEIQFAIDGGFEMIPKED